MLHHNNAPTYSALSVRKLSTGFPPYIVTNAIFCFSNRKVPKEGRDFRKCHRSSKVKHGNWTTPSKKSNRNGKTPGISVFN
jgi:hypothetical protein